MFYERTFRRLYVEDLYDRACIKVKRAVMFITYFQLEVYKNLLEIHKHYSLIVRQPPMNYLPY